MNNIVLKINGKKYNGWKEVTINKSLFSLTGYFNLGGVDIFPNDFKKWGFKLGDACIVEIDNQTIINGYIEDIPINYDGTNHDIQIGGRDKTADLIDCNFIETSQEWKNFSIAQLTRTLCDPFNIEASFDSSIPIAELLQTGTDFKYQPGMTVFEMLKPILDTKGILPVSYGDGKLTLTRSGSEKAYDSLELGKNIKNGSINQSIKDRFSTYIVRGQSSGADIFGQLKDYIEPEGIANDTVINRYRPTLIIPDNKVFTGDCLQRAIWERSKRAGQSVAVNYEVQGWVQSNGNIWPLNSLVQVKDHFLGINSTMLIADLSFEVNNDIGKITRLTLVDPKTFDTDPTAIIATNANEDPFAALGL